MARFDERGAALATEQGNVGEGSSGFSRPRDGKAANISSEGSSFTHELPRTRVVDRIDYLVALAKGRRVAHVGFVDSGCRGVQDARGLWLHEHLAGSASSIVGLDIDKQSVAEARAAGWDAHAVDCRDSAALAALGLEDLDLVIAGEVIEHIDAPGAFLDGLHALCGSETILCITTPNAYAPTNSMAALAHKEIIHPDHVALYSYRTLTELMARHGWKCEEVLTYVSRPAPVRPGASSRARLLTAGFNSALRAQGFIGRHWAPFVADGLVAVARAAPR